MKTLLAITMICSLLGTTVLNPPPLREGPGEGDDRVDCEFDPDVIAAFATFATLDITIDPKGKPLGAYQFELSSKNGDFRVVGIEAGDHPAFDHERPPYYDRVADERQTERLIIAEFARADLVADALPTQPVLIVKLHVMLVRDKAEIEKDPAFELTLITAGDTDGKKIDAKLSHTLQIPERPE